MSDFLCIVNKTKGTVLASRVKIASSVSARVRGLLGTASLAEDEGLWLKPCRSVHTFFMRYPIDVLFLDREDVAIAQATLAPWRLSRWVLRAASVLELPAGTLDRKQLAPGDRIAVKPI